MKPDLRRHAPPGMELGPWLKAYAAGMGLSLVYSLFFFSRFSDAKERLYFGMYFNRTLIPGAVMPDFAELLDGWLDWFFVVAAAMALFAAYCYASHWQGARSIYTMRRLPSKWELHRRCLTLPLAGAVLALLTAFLLLVIYYCYYIAQTPPQCLTPGQWGKIWRLP